MSTNNTFRVVVAGCLALNAARLGAGTVGAPLAPPTTPTLAVGSSGTLMPWIYMPSVLPPGLPYVGAGGWLGPATPEELESVRKAMDEQTLGASPPSSPPAELELMFKEVPTNTVFYFATDRNRSFPRLKITPSKARPLASRSGDASVPANTWVIARNPELEPPRSLAPAPLELDPRGAGTRPTNTPVPPRGEF